jgi:hypothetical protein
VILHDEQEQGILLVMISAPARAPWPRKLDSKVPARWRLPFEIESRISTPIPYHSPPKFDRCQNIYLFERVNLLYFRRRKLR